MPGSVIVSGARTPIGRLGGALAALGAVELGGYAIAEALRRAGISGEVVSSVAMGQVIQAGQGQNPARQAAARGGVPLDVPAVTLNKVCISGLATVQLADLLITSGEADVVVAGGMESMSRAPHLVDARRGIPFGDSALRDSLADGLTDGFSGLAMGAATDRDAAGASITRESQDALAELSHRRASIAVGQGLFEGEIVPVAVPQRRGEDVLVSADEGIRGDTTVAALGRLRPAFDPDGTITAGNASQISDGACAMVLTSRRTAERWGVRPLAEVVSYGTVAGPGTSLLTQPSRAIEVALGRCGHTLDELEVIEVNEAFAAVAVASARDLGVTPDRFNPNGGAIALGHPLGMSGSRLALTAALELRRRGGGLGVAALCGGGGLGDALVIRSVA